MDAMFALLQQRRKLRQLESRVTAVEQSGPGEAENGDDGWSPVLTGVVDGERVVMQIGDWIGGTGIKPAIGQYISTTGLTGNIAEALDVRGTIGIAGDVPTIGQNGNWYIGDTDTNVKAQGEDGNDGLTPIIGQNGNWYIGDTDTGIKAEGVDGNDGITPHIGLNKNWYIGDTDTGIKAEGVDGGGLVTTTVTISIADWSAGTSVVKTVVGVTATNLIWVAPSPDSYNKCAEFEIRASAQGIDQLTFVATSTPDAEVIMNVVIGADQ
jgi:hypothetical protein